MQPAIFAQIYKVDEKSRTIDARACDETVDKDGESLDMASSRPLFERWSKECYDASGGKSLGNVREMHGPVAAGKLTALNFDEESNALDVRAHIVDDALWSKICAGVLTGLSIGGRYAKKWTTVVGSKLVTKYTAEPSEISLVDRPCNPHSQIFEIHKRDGSVVKRAFASPTPTPESLAKAVADGLKLVGAMPNGTIGMIKSIHQRGARPFEPDFLRNYPATEPKTDATATAIAKRSATRAASTPPHCGQLTWMRSLECSSAVAACARA